MKPGTIMIDFERATLQAATNTFPTATVNEYFYLYGRISSGRSRANSYRSNTKRTVTLSSKPE
ncbi:hypothetical protein E2C01_069851 [Portunus trituberculatus]|uniref:Uncharacterized protein n=1 Tax=Portunus trituberculatus TaxID=210409 RepID=A0A5B7HZN7_PORTR|nr:hypothetical protein [Portunus trituberculatus]